MCGGRHNLPSQIIGHHDEEATDRATVISALLTGQYFAPVRVVAFNTTKRRHGLPIVTIIVTFIVTSSVGRFPRPLFALHLFWLQAHPSLPHRSGSATGPVGHLFRMHSGQHRQPFRAVDQHQVIAGRDVIALAAVFDASCLAASARWDSESTAAGSWVFSVSRCFRVDSVSSRVTKRFETLETARVAPDPLHSSATCGSYSAVRSAIFVFAVHQVTRNRTGDSKQQEGRQRVDETARQHRQVTPNAGALILLTGRP
jgi:hypothetical protein